MTAKSPTPRSLLKRLDALDARVLALGVALADSAARDAALLRRVNDLIALVSPKVPAAPAPAASPAAPTDIDGQVLYLGAPVRVLGDSQILFVSEIRDGTVAVDEPKGLGRSVTSFKGVRRVRQPLSPLGAASFHDQRGFGGEAGDVVRYDPTAPRWRVDRVYQDAGTRRTRLDLVAIGKPVCATGVCPSKVEIVG